MRMTVSTSVKPVLFGGGSTALRVALCLFFRYAHRSHVFSHERSLSLRLPIFASFHTLHTSNGDGFALMDLERLTMEYGEATYLLIPCTDECADIVSKHRTQLESKFIIRSPKEIFEEEKLFPLKEHNRKD
jgi:predicted ATP-grasp superfamily ATP-dependent carboligase